MNVLCYSRLDSTLGSAPLSRDNTISSRAHSSHSLSRYQSNRSSTNSRSGQKTILEHLQLFNERLTVVEQQMQSISNVLQRIDDRMNQSNMT